MIDKGGVIYYNKLHVKNVTFWEHSSAGRALALQARGHWFEPNCSHQIWPGSSVGLERQPVTLEVEGSSPFRVAKFASVAQLVEQGTENPCVDSSTLS